VWRQSWCCACIAGKRGGEVSRVTFDEALIPGGSNGDVVVVDEALEKLEALDARKARVVELRFFGGLTTEETAEVMKTSIRTVEREWSLAQAWLLRELSLVAGKAKGIGE